MNPVMTIGTDKYMARGFEEQVIFHVIPGLLFGHEFQSDFFNDLSRTPF